jgi:hypothetical protein
MASPASALAMSVLPVPGSPSSRIPLGGRAPSLLKVLGSFRNSTTYRTASRSMWCGVVQVKRVDGHMCVSKVEFGPEFVCGATPLCITKEEVLSRFVYTQRPHAIPSRTPTHCNRPAPLTG